MNWHYPGAAHVSKRMFDSQEPGSKRKTGRQHIRLLTCAAPSLLPMAFAKSICISRRNGGAFSSSVAVGGGLPIELADD